jgi:hypothetical protein
VRLDKETKTPDRNDNKKNIKRPARGDKKLKADGPPKKPAFNQARKSDGATSGTSLMEMRGNSASPGRIGNGRSGNDRPITARKTEGDRNSFPAEEKMMTENISADRNFRCKPKTHPRK